MGFLDFADKFVTPKKLGQYAEFASNSAKRAAEKVAARRAIVDSVKRAAFGLTLMEAVSRRATRDEIDVEKKTQDGIRGVARAFSRTSNAKPILTDPATLRYQPGGLPPLSGKQQPLAFPGVPLGTGSVTPTPTPSPTPSPTRPVKLPSKPTTQLFNEATAGVNLFRNPVKFRDADFNEVEINWNSGENAFEVKTHFKDGGETMAYARNRNAINRYLTDSIRKPFKVNVATESGLGDSILGAILGKNKPMKETPQMWEDETPKVAIATPTATPTPTADRSMMPSTPTFTTFEMNAAFQQDGKFSWGNTQVERKYDKKLPSGFKYEIRLPNGEKHTVNTLSEARTYIDKEAPPPTEWLTEDLRKTIEAQYIAAGATPSMARLQSKADVTKATTDLRGELLKAGEEEEDVDFTLNVNLRYGQLLNKFMTNAERQNPPGEGTERYDELSNLIMTQLEKEFGDDLERMGKKQERFKKDFGSIMKNLATGRYAMAELGLTIEKYSPFAQLFGDTQMKKLGEDMREGKYDGLQGLGYMMEQIGKRPESAVFYTEGPAWSINLFGVAEISKGEGESLYGMWDKEVGRPIAQGFLDPAGKAAYAGEEGFADLTGLEVGHPVSSVINSKITEFILVDALNPVTWVAVAATRGLVLPMKMFRAGNPIGGSIRLFSEMALLGPEPDIARLGLIAVRNPRLAAQALKNVPVAIRNTRFARSMMHVADNTRQLDAIAVNADRFQPLELLDPVEIRAGDRVGQGGTLDGISEDGLTAYVKIGDEDLVQVPSNTLKYSAKFGDEVILAPTKTYNVEEEIDRLRTQKGLTRGQEDKLRWLTEQLNEGKTRIESPVTPHAGSEYRLLTQGDGGFGWYVKKTVKDIQTAMLDWQHSLSDVHHLMPEGSAALARQVPPGKARLLDKYDGVMPMSRAGNILDGVNVPLNRLQAIENLQNGVPASGKLELLQDQVEWEIYDHYARQSISELNPSELDQLQYPLQSSDMSGDMKLVDHGSPFYDPTTKVNVTFDSGFVGGEAQAAMIEDAMRAFPPDMNLSTTVGTTMEDPNILGSAKIDGGEIKIRTNVLGQELRHTTIHEMTHAHQRELMLYIDEVNVQRLKDRYRDLFVKSRMRQITRPELVAMRLSPAGMLELDNAWRRLPQKGGRSVSSYALFHFEEYFAETMQVYLRNPDLLKHYDEDAHKILSEGFAARDRAAERAEAFVGRASRKEMETALGKMRNLPGGDEIDGLLARQDEIVKRQDEISKELGDFEILGDRERNLIRESQALMEEQNHLADRFDVLSGSPTDSMAHFRREKFTPGELAALDQLKARFDETGLERGLLSPKEEEKFAKRFFGEQKNEMAERIAKSLAKTGGYYNSRISTELRDALDDFAWEQRKDLNISLTKEEMALMGLPPSPLRDGEVTIVKHSDDDEFPNTWHDFVEPDPELLLDYTNKLVADLDLTEGEFEALFREATGDNLGAPGHFPSESQQFELIERLRQIQKRTGFTGGRGLQVSKPIREAFVAEPVATKIDDAIAKAVGKYGKESDEAIQLRSRKRRGDIEIFSRPPAAEGMKIAEFHGKLFYLPQEVTGMDAVNMMKKHFSEAEQATFDARMARAPKRGGRRAGVGREIKSDVPEFMQADMKPVRVKDEIERLRELIEGKGGAYSPAGMRQLYDDLKKLDEQGIVQTIIPNDAPPGMRLVKYEAPTNDLRTFYGASEMKTTKTSGAHTPSKRFLDEDDEYYAMTDEDPIFGEDAQAVSDAAIGRATASQVFVETTQPKWFHVSNIYKRDEQAREAITVGATGTLEERAKRTKNLRETKAMETGGGAAPRVQVKVTENGKEVKRTGRLVSPYADAPVGDVEGALAKLEGAEEGKVFVKLDDGKTIKVDIGDVSYVRTKAGAQVKGGRDMSRVSGPVTKRKAPANYGQTKPIRESKITSEEAFDMGEKELKTLDDTDLRGVGEQLGVVPSKDRVTLISRIRVVQGRLKRQADTASKADVDLSGNYPYDINNPRPVPPSDLISETGLLPTRTKLVLANAREGGVKSVEGDPHLAGALSEWNIKRGDMTIEQVVRELRNRMKTFEKNLAEAKLKYNADVEAVRISREALSIKGKPTEAKLEQAVEEAKAADTPAVPKADPKDVKVRLEADTGKTVTPAKVKAAAQKIEKHITESDESIEAAAIMDAAKVDRPMILSWTDEELEQLDEVTLWKASTSYYIEKDVLARDGTTLLYTKKIYPKMNKTRRGIINQIKRWQVDEGVRPAPAVEAVEPKLKKVPEVYEDKVPPDLVAGGEMDGRPGVSSEKELEEMYHAEERPARKVRQPRAKKEMSSADDMIDDASVEVQNNVRAQKGVGGGKKGGGGKKPPKEYEPSVGDEGPDDWENLEQTSRAYKVHFNRAVRKLRRELLESNSLANNAADSMRVGDYDLFKIDKKGYFTEGVTPKDPVYSLEYHDVLQSPHNYDWDDPKALAHAEEYTDSIRTKLRELRDAGVLDEETWKIWNNLDYFPRNVIEIEGEEVFFGPKSGIGSKQSIQLDRRWETADEALAFHENLKYVDSPAYEYELYIRKANALIAHKRFTDEALKYGRTRTDRINKIFAERVNDLTIRRDRLASEIKKLNSRITRGAHKSGTLLRSTERLVGSLRAREAKLQTRFKGMVSNTDAWHRVSNELLEVRLELNKARQDLKEISAGALNDLRTEKALRNDERIAVEAQLVDATKWKAREMRRAAKARPGSEVTLPQGMYGWASGYVFPSEYGELIRRGFEPRTGIGVVDNHVVPIMEWMRGVNSIFTPLWATGDLSVLGIQALTAMGMNPVAYLKAAGLGAASLQDPIHYLRYIKANREVIDRMIKRGVPMSGHDTTFDDVFSGRGKGAKAAQKMTRYFGLKASNDFFIRVLNVQAIELWKAGEELILNTKPGYFGKALREVYAEAFNLAPGAALDAIFSRSKGKLGLTRGEEGLDELADVISNLTGRMSIRAQSEIGEIQKLALGALPFAGRYTTAWLTLITRAVKSGGLHGALARRAIITFGAAMTGMYVGISALLGQDPHLDPSEPGKFFTIDVLGQRVGPGGMIRGFAQLGAKIYEDYDDPEAIAGHIYKWALGRASPVIQVARDLIKGETFEGYKLRTPEDFLVYGVSKFTPFTVQGVLKELENADVFTRIANGEKVINVLSEVQWARVAVGTAAQALGGRSFPVPLRETFNKEFERVLREDLKMTDAEINARETGVAYNPDSPFDRDLAEKTESLKKISNRMDDEALKKGREYAEKDKEREEKIAKLEEDAGLEDLAQRVLAGDQVAAAQWSQAASDFFNERSGLNKAFFDDIEDKETKTAIGKLVDEYYKKGDPNLYRDETGYIDWESREAALAQVLQKMDPKDAATLKNRDHFLSEAANQVYQMRKRAQNKKTEFEQQPKYGLIGKEQEDDLEIFMNRIEAAQTARVLETGKTPSKSKILRNLLKIGWTGVDRNLLITAYYLSTDHLHDLAYGTARVEYLNNNSDLVLFHPYLYNDLRDEEKAAYLDLNPDQSTYLENRYGEVDSTYGTLTGFESSGQYRGSSSNPIMAAREGRSRYSSTYSGPLTKLEKASGQFSLLGPR